MRKISDIYDEYKIMPRLRDHMLRVAAVAKIICKNFEGTLSEEDIVTTCLLHDMGNILKFQLDLLPGFTDPEGLVYWEGVKEEYKRKYGEDEHLATIQIAKELKVSDRILELINAISFVGSSETAAGADFGSKIVEYCDSRVTPFGITSLEGRLMDLRKRYGHKGGDTPQRRAYESAVRLIEKQIFEKCTIKPEDINDETATPIIAELKNFMIK